MTPNRSTPISPASATGNAGLASTSAVWDHRHKQQAAVYPNGVDQNDSTDQNAQDQNAPDPNKDPTQDAAP